MCVIDALEHPASPILTHPYNVVISKRLPDVWCLAPLNDIESKRAVSVLLHSFIIHFPSIPVVELLDLVGNQLLSYACAKTDRANHKHSTKYIDLVDKVRGAFSKLKARVGVGCSKFPH